MWLARRHAVARHVRCGSALGAGVGFFLRLLTSGAIGSGRYHEGSVYDLAWIVPFICYLWAALEAPRSAGETGAGPAAADGTARRCSRRRRCS